MTALLIGIVGISDLLAGLALLLTPRWFYEYPGHFPPFNQHYEGDAGSFVFAIGVGLVISAIIPAQRRPLLAIGVLASVLHLGNHVYASLIAHADWAGTAIVAAQAGLLLVAARELVARGKFQRLQT